MPLKQSKADLDIFCNNYPNSGHHLDEERFKKFVIKSFREKEALTYDELFDILRTYKNPNGSYVFSEEQARERSGEYDNYIDLLKMF